MSVKIENEDPTETQARQETTCRGCEGAKDLGLVVCWDCFKYRKELPFKDSGMTLTMWLNEIGR